MRFAPILPLLLALAGLPLVSCSSAPSPAAEEEVRGEWSLEPAKDSTRRVTLLRGMTPTLVTKLLGEPRRIRTVKKATEPTQEWTYRRSVLGGPQVSSALSKQGRMTVLQRTIYIETLELTFVAERLTTVKRSRVREDLDSGVLIPGRS